MVILLRLGLACDWATRRPADRVLARSSDLWRAFTLPEYSTRTKKEYGRLPPSANTFILAIGRYTAVFRPLPRSCRVAMIAAHGHNCLDYRRLGDCRCRLGEGLLCSRRRFRRRVQTRTEKI